MSKVTPMHFGKTSHSKIYEPPPRVPQKPVQRPKDQFDAMGWSKSDVMNKKPRPVAGAFEPVRAPQTKNPPAWHPATNRGS